MLMEASACPHWVVVVRPTGEREEGTLTEMVKAEEGEVSGNHTLLGVFELQRPVKVHVELRIGGRVGSNISECRGEVWTEGMNLGVKNTIVQEKVQRLLRQCKSGSILDAHQLGNAVYVIMVEGDSGGRCNWQRAIRNLKWPGNVPGACLLSEKKEWFLEILAPLF